MKMRKLSLFSGIGGLDLAAKMAGMETVAFCEREPFPRKVLETRFPNIPIYDDVCTLTYEKLKEDGIVGPDRTIDIISAGYPCQPFSAAGKRRGKEDDRHLWPEVARLLGEIRPHWFVGENVAGHVTLGLDDVLTDLENLGYSAQPFIIPASAVGAPHRRDRVFIVAYTDKHATWRKSGEHDRQGRQSTGAFSSANVSSRDGQDDSERAQSRRELEQLFIEQFGEHTSWGNVVNAEYLGPHGSAIGRSAHTPSNHDTQGQKEALKPKRTSGQTNSEVMVHSAIEGLSIGGSTEFETSAAQDQTGVGIESKRSGDCEETLAHTDSIGNACPNRHHDIPKRSANSQEWQYPQFRPSDSGQSESMANASSIGQSQPGEPVQPCHSKTSKNGQTSEFVHVRVGREWPAKRRLGGILDGFSKWLDEYPWPAGMGQEQHDWEPPRTAVNVPDRVARLKALGNAVNPIQAFPVFYVISRIHDYMVHRPSDSQTS